MTTDTWEEAELFRSDWSPGITGLNLNGKGIVIHSNQPSAGVTEFDPDGW
jgi:hypothetical protein